MLACGRGRALRIELYFVASLLMFAFVVCRDQMTDTDAKIIKYIEAVRCRCDHIHAEANGNVNNFTIQDKNSALTDKIAMKRLMQGQDTLEETDERLQRLIRREGRGDHGVE